MRKNVSILSILTICAVVPTQSFGVSYGIQTQMLDREIAQLIQERDQKAADLTKCAKANKGFKIAGITTLSLTGVGIGVNIGQAVTKNKLDKKIDSEKQRIKEEELARQRAEREKIEAELAKSKVISSEEKELLIVYIAAQREEVAAAEGVVKQKAEELVVLNNLEGQLAAAAEVAVGDEKAKVEEQLKIVKEKKEGAREDLSNAQDIAIAAQDNLEEVVQQALPAGVTKMEVIDGMLNVTIDEVVVTAPKLGSDLDIKPMLPKLDPSKAKLALKPVATSTCDYIARMKDNESYAEYLVKDLVKTYKSDIRKLSPKNGVGQYEQETNAVTAQFNSDFNEIVADYRRDSATAFQKCTSPTDAGLHNTRMGNFERKLTLSQTDAIGDMSRKIRNNMQSKNKTLLEDWNAEVRPELSSEDKVVSDNAKQITAEANVLYNLENVNSINAAEKSRKEARTEKRENKRDIRQEKRELRTQIEKKQAEIGKIQIELREKYSALRTRISDAEYDLKNNHIYKQEPSLIATKQAQIDEMKAELNSPEPKLEQLQQELNELLQAQYVLDTL